MSTTTIIGSMWQWRGFSDGLPPVSWCLERLPVVVLALSIAFLQGFALTFWHDLVGPSGWGVSAGIEIIHLWAWYRAAVSARFARLGWVLLAVAATALLLAGAIHEVTRPMRTESARIEANGQERQSQQEEALVLQANLAAFRDMAAGQGRRGWQDNIRRDTARLQAITERLRILNNYSDNQTHIPWLNQVTQGGVIAVAVLFQLSAILAVWCLSGGSRNTVTAFRPDPPPKSEPETAPTSVSETVETFRPDSKHPDRDLYRQLWGAIEAHASSNSARLAGNTGKVSQRSLARNLGIGAPDLCAVKRLSEGQAVPRNPSQHSVETLAARFGIEIPKQAILAAC